MITPMPIIVPVASSCSCRCHESESEPDTTTYSRLEKWLIGLGGLIIIAFCWFIGNWAMNYSFANYDSFFSHYALYMPIMLVCVVGAVFVGIWVVDSLSRPTTESVDMTGMPIERRSSGLVRLNQLLLGAGLIYVGGMMLGLFPALDPENPVNHLIVAIAIVAGGLWLLLSALRFATENE